MKIAIAILLGFIAWLLLLFITYIATVYIIYFCQEVNHEFRKMKRSIKNSMWDLEWRWKHR